MYGSVNINHDKFCQDTVSNSTQDFSACFNCNLIYAIHFVIVTHYYRCCPSKEKCELVTFVIMLQGQTEKNLAAAKIAVVVDRVELSK